MKGRITIDFERCKECHLCIQACRKGSLGPAKGYNSKGYRPVAFKDAGDCTGCALCVAPCPVDWPLPGASTGSLSHGSGEPPDPT